MVKKSEIKRKKMIIIGIAVFSLIIMTSLITGYLQFYVAYIRCGQYPVMAKWNPGFGATGEGYVEKGDVGYNPSLFDNYYCSQKEAEADGLEPNPLSEEGLRRE